MRSIDDSENLGKREANANSGRRDLAKTRTQFFFQGVWRDSLEHQVLDTLATETDNIRKVGVPGDDNNLNSGHADLVHPVHEV
jgi:hypothetical protein